MQKLARRRLLLTAVALGGPGSGGAREGAGRPAGGGNLRSGNELTKLGPKAMAKYQKGVRDDIATASGPARDALIHHDHDVTMARNISAQISNEGRSIPPGGSRPESAHEFAKAAGLPEANFQASYGGKAAYQWKGEGSTGKTQVETAEHQANTQGWKQTGSTKGHSVGGHDNTFVKGGHEMVTSHYPSANKYSITIREK